MTQHIPVFYNEVLANTPKVKKPVFVDLTLGGGGHAKGLLAGSADATLIAFDVDQNAINQFIDNQDWQTKPEKDTEIAEGVSKAGNKVYLCHRNFADLTQILTQLRVTEVNMVLVDLGWSSDQLQSIPGLSYAQPNQELDMRLDQTKPLAAKDILNLASKTDLLKLLADNADLTGKIASDIANAILTKQRSGGFANTRDLLDTLQTIAAATQQNNIVARVFQALRIAVNAELSALQSLLPQALNALTSGGVLQVISFHSGEERVIESFWRSWVAASVVSITERGVLRPSVTELRANISAHSAKLWICTRN